MAFASQSVKTWRAEHLPRQECWSQGLEEAGSACKYKQEKMDPLFE